MREYRTSRATRLQAFLSDQGGAVLIEAAFVIPLLVALLAGVVTYAMYFMAAHSLQSVANEGARASLAGLNSDERDALVDRAIEQSLLQATLVDPEEVAVETSVDGDFFTVRLDYDASANAVFSTSLIPMPGDHIVRSATIELQSY
jgi:Flp pilus assembly protein TadG